MQAPNKNSTQIFHMSLVEPLLVLAISLFGIILAVVLFWSGIGDFIKTIMLFLISVSGLLVALTMTRKVEITGSELVISYLVTRHIIAREDIDAFFLDEQGINRRTRKFVTIHLVNGRRVKFKGVKEGNQYLLQALERFTEFKPAVDSPEKLAKPDY